MTASNDSSASSMWTPLALGVAVLLIAGSFFRASNAPIWHLDTWSHWKYGEWICTHGTLPTHEPFTEFADQARPLVDIWWLSQVLGYQIYSRVGMEGIALLYGLVEALKATFYLLALRRQSGSWPVAVVGLVVVLALRWNQFGVFRPQQLGELCWAALLVLAARPVLRRSEVILIALTLGLWANLHASFVLGFVLLGTQLVGRSVELYWRTRDLQPVMADADLRMRGWAFLAGFLATWLNPYGPGLWTAVVRFNAIPTLQYVAEWLPFTPMTTYSSIALVLSGIVTLIIIRLSPRRFRLEEVLLLAGFFYGSWTSARFFIWWTSLCPWVLLPHVVAILEPWQAKVPAVQGWFWRRGVFLLGAVGALALLLGSGTGHWLLTRTPRPLEQQVDAETPLEPARVIAAAVNDDQPLRVFASTVWSDYFLWQLPPQVNLFWYSHWNCFTLQRMGEGSRLRNLSLPPTDWKDVIKRNHLDIVALSRADADHPLYDYLQEQRDKPDSQWEILYPKKGDSDAQGIVARRRPQPAAR